MALNKPFDVIIIGGSYAGLSAAMALGRSRRHVLIIDNGQPCNRMVVHAHNLLTHDGEEPASIARTAKAQVMAYPTIQFITGTAAKGAIDNNIFSITLDDGAQHQSRKLLLATGVRDMHPLIEGFEDCWGKSIAHCPYCHGYEVRDEALGVLANGEIGFEFTKLIYNLSKSVMLFTNGKADFTAEQLQKLASHNIPVIVQKIATIQHEAGMLHHVMFKDGSRHPIHTLFAKSDIELHGNLHHDFGCTIGTEGMNKGLIVTDDFGKTNISGLYAAGDNSTPMRSLAMATATGGKAGAIINHELVGEDF